MKKTISILLTVLMLMSAFAGLNITAIAAPIAEHDGWIQGEAGEWYYIESGQPVREEWRLIGGKWYWFFEDGEMASNCRVGIPNSSGKESIYVFAKSGAMMSNGWGKLTDESGFTEWHYLNKNGSAVTNAWKKIGGKWYWFEENGVMASGDVYNVNNKNYAFEDSGALHEKEGWFKYSWELFDGDGNKTGVDIEWVYTNSNGTCYSGWKKSGNDWYYLDPEYGYMIKDGVFRIGANQKTWTADPYGLYGNFGKLYAFDKNGKMLSNTWYKGTEEDGYPLEFLNNNFEMYSTNGEYNWYYFGSDGAAVTGWKQIKNVWYYFVPNFGLCYMVTGQQLIGEYGVYDKTGDAYMFKDSGAMVANSWIKLPDEDGWYYAGSSGALVTGWKQIKGSWYYFINKNEKVPGQKSYEMRIGWMFLADGVYYLDKDGKMVTGEKFIDGYTCTFDKSGRLISKTDES